MDLLPDLLILVQIGIKASLQGPNTGLSSGFFGWIGTTLISLMSGVESALSVQLLA